MVRNLQGCVALQSGQSVVNCWVKGDGAEFLYRTGLLRQNILIFFLYNFGINFNSFNNLMGLETMRVYHVQGCVIPPRTRTTDVHVRSTNGEEYLLTYFSLSLPRTKYIVIIY